MLLIGLTGSIGSGKSRAATCFAALGCEVVDADQLSRQLTAPGGAALGPISKIFGAGFLDSSGGLDRAAMRDFVFKQPAAKRRLEEILHPLIIAARAELIAGLEERERLTGTQIVFVSEAALSIEAGLTGEFDHLVLVTAPEEIRRARVTARDSHGKESFDRVSASQMADAEKARYADILLDNSGSADDLEIAVRGLLDELKRRGPLLKQSQALAVLDRMLNGAANGTTAELFWEKRLIRRRFHEDGRLKESQSGVEWGAGLRWLLEGATRYRAVAGGGITELLAAADSGRKSESSDGHHPAITLAFLPRPIAAESFAQSADAAARLAAESAVDQDARALGGARLRQFSLSFGAVEQQVVIATARLEGGKISASYCREFRPRHVASLEAVVQSGRRTSQALRVHGATGMQGELAGAVLISQAQDVVQTALDRLQARPLPPGRWPVVFAAGAGGTLIHEAVGHPLEADFFASGATFFNGLLQTQAVVAAPRIQIVDDGLQSGAFGSSAFDDEGHPSTCAPLISSGRVAGVLAGRPETVAGPISTGHARRENYRELPIPRMRNTNLLAGDDDPAAILRELKKGVFVTQLGGGEVDTASGNFIFTASESFWIENGEKMYPLAEFTLAGNALKFLKNIRRLGNDFGSTVGICEKDGQDAPVSDGMPTLRVDGLTLSG